MLIVFIRHMGLRILLDNSYLLLTYTSISDLFVSAYVMGCLLGSEKSEKREGNENILLTETP